jgi:hypothetical protein
MDGFVVPATSYRQGIADIDWFDWALYTSISARGVFPSPFGLGRSFGLLPHLSKSAAIVLPTSF